MVITLFYPHNCEVGTWHFTGRKPEEQGIVGLRALLKAYRDRAGVCRAQRSFYLDPVLLPNASGESLGEEVDHKMGSCFCWESNTLVSTEKINYSYKSYNSKNPGAEPLWAFTRKSLLDIVRPLKLFYN